MFQGTFLPFVFKKIVLVEAAWRNKAMKRVVCVCVCVGGGGGAWKFEINPPNMQHKSRYKEFNL